MNTKQIIKRVYELNPKPIVIESLWAKQKRGWGVLVSAIVEEPSSQHPQYTEVPIEFMQEFGGDLRISMRLVPPWPEIEKARELGEAIEQQLNIPYHHNVSEEPTEIILRWWDNSE